MTYFEERISHCKLCKIETDFREKPRQPRHCLRCAFWWSFPALSHHRWGRTAMQHQAALNLGKKATLGWGWFASVTLHKRFWVTQLSIRKQHHCKMSKFKSAQLLFSWWFWKNQVNCLVWSESHRVSYHPSPLLSYFPLAQMIWIWEQYDENCPSLWLLKSDTEKWKKPLPSNLSATVSQALVPGEAFFTSLDNLLISWSFLLAHQKRKQKHLPSVSFEDFKTSPPST